MQRDQKDSKLYELRKKKIKKKKCETGEMGRLLNEQICMAYLGMEHLNKKTPNVF